LADYEQILCEVSEGLLTLTLNRPDRLNALTTQMRHEILGALEEANADDDVRAIIVTGAGRAFCAGPDMKEAAPFGTGAGDRPVVDLSGRIALRIFDSTKPVIAAINGPAIGVGVGLTLPMDVRIASSSAVMGFAQARRGVMLEACTSWFLPRVVGISQALEWVETGRIFTADDALAGGLVRSVFPPDELLPAARAIALEIAESTAAVAVAVSRQLILRSLGMANPRQAHIVECQLLGEMGPAPDAREGIESFREGRPPRFAGRVSTDLPPSYPWWEEPSEPS